MAQKTRTGPSATPRKPYGSFAGKTEEGEPTFQAVWAKDVNTLIGSGVKRV